MTSCITCVAETTVRLRAEGLQCGAETLLNTMDAVERRRALDTVNAMDTLHGSIGIREKRSRVDARHLVSVSVKEVAAGHAHRWDPRITDKWGKVKTSALEGVDAAKSAWAAGQCGRSLVQELLP